MQRLVAGAAVGVGHGQAVFPVLTGGVFPLIWLRAGDLGHEVHAHNAPLLGLLQQVLHIAMDHDSEAGETSED